MVSEVLRRGSRRSVRGGYAVRELMCLTLGVVVLVGFACNGFQNSGL